MEDDEGKQGDQASGSQLNENSDSDFEFEDMDTENMTESPNKPDSEQRGQKRNVCSDTALCFFRVFLSVRQLFYRWHFSVTFIVLKTLNDSF